MVTIISNRVPRLLKYGYEMPEVCRRDFDYIDREEFDYHSFFTYRGQWYDLSEFMRVEHCEELRGWDGYSSDTYFSGVLVKLCQDNDYVIVGRYFS